MEPTSQILTWIETRWSSASWAVRALCVLFALGLIALLAFEVGSAPGIDELRELHGRSHPLVQFSVLVFLLILIIAVVVYARSRSAKADRLKEECRRLESELAAIEIENRQNQQRMDRLLDVESRAGLWKRTPVVVPPGFVPMSQRPTRFLTVLNFKGGVGKTTLSANIAALLATGDIPKRVLLVDVDFQNTLGKAAVDRARLDVQAQHDGFVNRLLTTDGPSDRLVAELALPMYQVPGAKVIVSSDLLDKDEFYLQARYFIDEQADPRFRFRMHLHAPCVFDKYDLVIFDCPPRVTVSVVNAVACSDFVLVPTRLDHGSVESVPRTLKWLESLGPVCPGSVIGVVANHAAMRSGNLVRAEQQSYEYLRDAVEFILGPGRLFAHPVPDSPRAVTPESAPVGGLSAGGRDVFKPFVTELAERLFR